MTGTVTIVRVYRLNQLGTVDIAGPQFEENSSATSFVAGTREAKFYINGVQVGNRNWHMCALDAAQTFQIGGRLSVYTQDSIDEVRILNIARPMG